MESLVAVAINNLTSPMVLFFILGFFAAMARVDLSLPQPVAKTVAIYLMLAIGFKGGVDPSAKDAVLEHVYAFLEQRVGVLSFHEVSVVRDNHFK